MGCKQVGIEKHFTEYTKECCQIKSKVAQNSGGKHHPEGCNKIQDKYKSEKFVVVGKHPEPNVYHIEPVNGNGPEWTVNQCQLHDLWKTQNDGGLTSPQDNHDGAQVPSFNPKPMTKNHTQFLMIMPLTQKGNLQ